jgi:hypothetical protein
MLYIELFYRKWRIVVKERMEVSLGDWCAAEGKNLGSKKEEA